MFFTKYNDHFIVYMVYKLDIYFALFMTNSN